MRSDLRATTDPFGHTAERKLERQLVRDYEALFDELASSVDAERLKLAVRLARLPEAIRGFDQVKLANVATVKAQWADLLERFRKRETEPAAHSVGVAARVRSVAEV